MHRTLCNSICRRLTTLACALPIFGVVACKEKTASTLHGEGAGAGRDVAISTTNFSATNLATGSATNDSVLIFKSSSKDETGSDLWFRNDSGREQFVARQVTAARLSPDGTKIAYTTVDRELFIQTSTGRPLAQIPRASEPFWSDDSLTVKFMAIPSADYPDLQQLAVYNLQSGGTNASELSTSNTANPPDLNQTETETETAP